MSLSRFGVSARTQPLGALDLEGRGVFGNPGLATCGHGNLGTGESNSKASRGSQAD